jgi:hypothetical protein
MSRNTKGLALVTGASSGTCADRREERGHAAAPGFAEHDDGTPGDIATIVAAAPEILEGIYNGLDDVPPRLKPVDKT